jgi:hypothetical protein
MTMPTPDQIRERVRRRMAASEALKAWQEPESDAIMAGMSPDMQLRYLDVGRRCRIEDAEWARRGLPSRHERVMAKLGRK